MDKENNKVEETMPEDSDIIQLVNEDGDTVNFYHVATIELEGKWFVVFQPAEELEDVDEEEVAIFELQTGDDGEDVFVPIEDESLLDRVYDEYTKLVEENCECGEDHDAHEGGCGGGCAGCGGKCK